MKFRIVSPEIPLREANFSKTHKFSCKLVEEIMEKKLMRKSVVTRLAGITGLIALATAIIVYVGGDFRTASLYREQRRTRAEFLARSISYGMRNLIVAKGMKQDVESMAGDVLRRAKQWDPLIVGLEIENNRKEKIYSFHAPGVDSDSVSRVSVDIDAESGFEGRVTVWHSARELMENEKEQQVAMLGNTIASMTGHYLQRGDYFQALDMTRSMLSEYPDVLYGSVTGPGGIEIYSQGMDRHRKLLTDKVNRRAEAVSSEEPIIIQETGKSRLRGRTVEVAVLVSDGNRRLGVVRIGYSMASLARASQRTRQMLTALIFGAALAAFLVSIAVTRGVVRPLGELTRAARVISPHSIKGETRLEEAEADIRKLSEIFNGIEDRFASRGDEVSELASSFSDMIHNLNIYIGQLKVLYQNMSLTDRLHAMGQLSAGIAHEINNPLTIMSTYTQMMLRKKDLPDSVREEIGIISEEIDRISEKVKELQSFSQESAFRFVETDINLLLGKTLDLCRHQIGKSGARLEVDIESEEPIYARVDSGRMRQVFLNLILNAIQAMEGSASKTLKIGVRKLPEGMAEVSVADTGAGIEGEHLGRIFDPFFTTKKPGQGTGLGLAISYNILKSHGGDITVESRKGDGATFRVTFPLDGPPAA